MSKVSTRTNYFPNRYCIQAGWIDLLSDRFGAAGPLDPLNPSSKRQIYCAWNLNAQTATPSEGQQTILRKLVALTHPVIS